MKRVVIIIVSLILLLLFSAIIQEAFQPKPFRWDLTLKSLDREPYGGYVFYNQLESFFPEKEVSQLDKSDFDIYSSQDQMQWEYSDYSYDSDTVLYYENMVDVLEYEDFNIVCVANYFKIDESNSRSLFQHIYQGNNAVIAAQVLPTDFTKYLDIEIDQKEMQFLTNKAKQDLYRITFLDKKYELRPYEEYFHISKTPLNHEVIAKGKNGDIIGLKTQIGQGWITIFTMPIVFSNYYLLKEDNDIAASLLTSLPNENTRWSNMLVGRQKREDKSLMDFIHSQQSLTWAFYILLFSVLIYFAMQIRRVQRAVPVVLPPGNDALKFVDTISNLYFIKQDHKVMMEKKMTYFLEWIRGRYHLDTNKIDQVFVEKLSNQSGVSEENVDHLFKTYNQLIKKQKLTDLEFLRFHKLLQNFK